MNWFYAQDNRQVGPVDDDELARLVQAGAVTGATLVWHSGLTTWQPYAQASAGMAGAVAPAYPGANQTQCSQCGGIFPADEVVTVDGYNVCASCKPVLLQKLRQGVSPAIGAHGMLAIPYAGFWIRAAAELLDGMIMIPAAVAIYFALLAWYPAAVIPTSSGDWIARILYQLFSVALQGAYDIFFTGRFGGTPGKLICGLRVVRSDGSYIRYGRATGRHFARILSGLPTLMIGFIIAGFDDQKRALHDYIADTRVIYR